MLQMCFTYTICISVSKITCCGGEVMLDVTCAPVFDRVIWFVGVVYACLKMDISFDVTKM